jgi:hypothetical protein
MVVPAGKARGFSRGTVKELGSWRLTSGAPDSTGRLPSKVGGAPNSQRARGCRVLRLHLRRHLPAHRTPPFSYFVFTLGAVKLVHFGALFFIPRHHVVAHPLPENMRPSPKSLAKRDLPDMPIQRPPWYDRCISPSPRVPSIVPSWNGRHELNNYLPPAFLSLVAVARGGRSSPLLLTNTDEDQEGFYACWMTRTPNRRAR